MRKMTSTLVLAIAMLVTAGAAAQTADQKKFAGRWEGQRSAEGRIDQVAVVFDVAAKGVTGTLTFGEQGTEPLEHVAISGHTATFDVSSITCTAVIDDSTGTMTLTAHFDGRTLWEIALSKKIKS